MNREEFERLEDFNVDYDISIDEEEYIGLLHQVTLLDGDGAPLDDPTDLQALEAVLQVPTIRVRVDAVCELSLLDEGIERAWASLLIIKRLRAGLQARIRTPEGTLERLAEYAVSGLAALSPAAGDGPETAEFRKTLCLLQLNEVCACYRPELSIGFAAQALERVNRSSGPETNIYELVALLNRGVGYAHLHQHSAALRDLSGVIEECEGWEDEQEHYLPEGDGGYASGRQNLGDAVRRGRWSRYVYVPAVLHTAEVLSDLSRSTEQLPMLAKLNNIDGEYSTKRRVLLEVLAKMDGNLWAKLPGEPPKLPNVDVEELHAWAEAEMATNRYSLRQKCFQVSLTYDLKYLRESVPPPGDAPPMSELHALRESLSGFEEQSEALGGDEARDASLLWIDYYDLFMRYAKASALVDEQDVSRLRQVTESFISASRFPDREKSRERLLKALKKAGVEKPALWEVEAALLRELLEDPRAPLWQKTRASRRLERIGHEAADDLEAILRLPSDESAQGVVLRAKDAFCNQACPQHPNPADAVCVSKTCRTNTYQRVLGTNNKSFLMQLVHPSSRPDSLQNSYCLTVLRRWQSFTPALSTGAADDSRGGGYFVYRTDGDGHVAQGLVVDPGFDFVENFLAQGFSIRDIDAVIMTHAHVDHTADFLRLVTLVVEYNKNRDKEPEKKLLALMSPGCFERFERAISGSWEYFSDVIVMDTGQAIDKGRPRSEWSDYLLQLTHFRVSARFALHNDTTSHDSVGLVVSGIDESKKARPLVAFTGDTMWWSSIGDQYADVPTVCANLGGIVPYGKRYGGQTVKIPGHLLQVTGVKEVVEEENHLYWPGFSMLTEKLNHQTRLVVVTELGEELKGGLRTDMVRQLKGEPMFLPEDIGLTVKLSEAPEVLCCACGRTVDSQDTEFRSYGRDESIYYVCRACAEYRPDAVREVIADYQQHGWPRESNVRE